MTKTSQETISAPARVPALDGVRGLAILLVILYHGMTMTRNHPLDRVLIDIAGSCWTGVDLFFLLSGFLITGILLDTKASPNFFKNFYGRRFVRIFPLYYLSLVFLFYIYTPMFEPTNKDLRLLQDNQFWFWSHLSNFWMAARGGFPRAGYLNQYWSLAIEEQFYLIWPALVFFLDRKRLRFICITCFFAALGLRTALLLSGAGAVSTYVSFATRMDALTLGALIAILVREKDSIPALVRNFRWIGYASGAGILAFILAFGGMKMSYAISPAGEGTLHTTLLMTIGFSLSALFAAALIVKIINAEPSSLLVRVFSNPFLAQLGKYSYSIYILNYPIMVAMKHYGMTARAFPTLFGSQLPGQIIFYAVFIVICMSFGQMSWNLFEKHFLKAKKFFSYDTEVQVVPASIQRPAPASVFSVPAVSQGPRG